MQRSQLQQQFDHSRLSRSSFDLSCIDELSKSETAAVYRLIEYIYRYIYIPPLPDDLILCTTDVVGLYLNIPHEEGLIVIRKDLDTRKDKTISTDSLIELEECVLEINIFENDKSVFKQLRGTAIGTKSRHLMLSYLWIPWKKTY